MYIDNISAKWPTKPLEGKQTDSAMLPSRFSPQSVSGMEFKDPHGPWSRARCSCQHGLKILLIVNNKSADVQVHNESE